MLADTPHDGDFRHLRIAAAYAARKAGYAEALHAVSVLAKTVAPTAVIHGRIKSIESASRKMQVKHLDLDHILDSVAVRIIVPSTAECYRFVRRIHARLNSVKGELDDYIENPKANGYRSLHTTLLGPRGHPVEVQVRTLTMHAVAEHGSAAHWRYKEEIAASRAVRHIHQTDEPPIS